MAPAPSFLIGLCFSALLVVTSAHGREVTISVHPATAEVCVWRVTAPEKRCPKGSVGRFVLDVYEDSFVEIAAHSHFSATLSGTGFDNDTTVRLDPLPVLRWPGWDGEAAAESVVQWLATDQTGRWSEVGRLESPGHLELPGETRAIRLVSSMKGASPRTFFPATPRSSLQLTPEKLLSGGEIAFCLVRDGRPVPKSEFILRVPDDLSLNARTEPSGCAALAGLRPGRYELRSADDEFDPVRAVVSAGESQWLGLINLPMPATILLRVTDSNPDRRYGAILRPTFAQPGKPPEPKEIASGSDVAWVVHPGTYDVLLRPHAFPLMELRASVTVIGGEETVVSMQPLFVTVWGRATQGDVSAAHLSLVFRHEDDRYSLTVRATTDVEGAYEAILPRPGPWSVTVTAEGQRNWKPRQIAATVPLAERHEWNLSLPAGKLAGRVMESSGEAPVVKIPVEVRWQSDEDGPGLVTASTDGDGEFEIAALPEGEVSVTVSEASARMFGYRPPVPQILNLPLVPERAIEFLLTPAQTRGKLLVRGPSGEPVPTAQAFLASSDVRPRLLGQADATGGIALPADIPLPLAVYVVATGYPWKRVVIRDESDREVAVAMPAAHGVVTQLMIPEGPEAAFAERPWGLIDEYGDQVPVFFHLLRQGRSPVPQGNAIVVPLAAQGQYRVWLQAGGVLRQAGTVILPSASPIVLSLR